VGGVVVQDDVHHLTDRHRRLDGVEEADEFLMPVPRRALAEHGAVQHVQCRGQRRRAIAGVVVGLRGGLALGQRQPRLGAFEGLDLRLLIDRERQRVLRRVHVEADHVLNLLDELGIAGEFEGAHPMRLEAVRERQEKVWQNTLIRARLLPV